ncbi:RNA polymerase sigma factor [Flavobacterium lacus]|uniref:RNA polymerase sigma-70 factor (ECF subfamily) n=1 Tax=Flavobacterium lacus TaxID=1353778 RepID=A0A328WQU0_9FLAO|nr:RNA polymerase sigma factor [Flavobacterium lacus]RAR48503.1 RNA polymerase sigma-70 factor (ECF subfamily) [Flavobacterium lacus]
MEKQAKFNELFNTHYPKVLRLCKGYFNGDVDFAADASQEVFIKVWENLDSFRNESSISTWIFRIAVNTCLVYLRKKSTKKEIRSEQFPNLITENYSPEIEEKLSKMYACIQKLDEMGKMIILMVLEGMEYNEIAQVVGLTEETLRVRIHRIKKSLTQCVQK